MDIGFLKSQGKEVKKMNDGKVGDPFEYSHTHIQFLAFLKIGFKIAYRTVQGIVRGLSDYIRIEMSSVGRGTSYTCIIQGELMEMHLMKKLKWCFI
jgi:hypothetical protein